MSIADIDRLWLETLSNEMKGRPLARKRKRPLSPHTVRNLLQAWSQFFDWLDANGDSLRFGNWQAPRRWEELFAVRVTELMTKAERDANADGPARPHTRPGHSGLPGGPPNDSHRIWILLGLFAGLGQREIASLRRDEFDLAGGLLTHRRNKTGQRGQAWLPPELVAMIRSYFKATPADSDNTASSTSTGSKLVTGKSDAVRQAWDDVVDRVEDLEKNKRGFYHLRKFAGDYAMRSGGADLRDAMLAHTPDSVGAKHYSNTRDFAAVIRCQQSLYAELAAKGMFDRVAVSNPKGCASRKAGRRRRMKPIGQPATATLGASELQHRPVCQQSDPLQGAEIGLPLPSPTVSGNFPIGSEASSWKPSPSRVVENLDLF